MKRGQSEGVGEGIEVGVEGGVEGGVVEFGRRDFFKSLKGVIFAREEWSGIRPPYNIDGSKFVKCISCAGYCMKVCEEGIIRISKYNVPYIDFREGGYCTFCKECVKACSYGVLEEGGVGRIDVEVKINKDLCLSWKAGDGCTECTKACDEKAILFYGGYRGEIDTRACTGCLRCVKACDYGAIEVGSVSLRK